MKWKDYIAEITSKGLSQSQIAARVGCGQATISDLASGKTKEPRYSLGVALMQVGQGQGVEAPRAARPAITKEA